MEIRRVVLRRLVAVATFALLMVVARLAIAEERVLFRFDQPESLSVWRAVNDGVMGGRSVGRFRLSDDQNLEFFGTLSLENNGGFASVRAMGRKLELKRDDVIVARVRGDGREYNFNLYSERTRYSYRKSFKAPKDEWVEVRLPVSEFRATWRGRRFPNQQLDAGSVNGLGILLGDKQPGPFQLEVAWIHVESAGQ